MSRETDMGPEHELAAHRARVREIIEEHRAIFDALDD